MPLSLENDQVISVLKRVSRANNKEVWEFAAFAHTEELERFDEYAWPYFEGVPLAELKDYFSEIGIKSYRSVLNREGFEQDFRIF